MPIRIDLTLPPTDAMSFFRSKGLQETFSWMDMLHQEHDSAFTVAKMMDVDLLREMRSAVDEAIAEGMTLRDFRRQIQPRLMEAGWWGKAEMVDPHTGELRTVQLGSPRRLRVIFETNMRTAYAAGHWAQIADQATDAPYLLYDSVDDGRTRPEHAHWDGKVFRVDDSFWDQWFPPNGWGCRCSVIQLDEDQLRELGKSGPDVAPPTPTRDWVNPRTGAVHRVPIGIDPGWAYHPGRSRAPNLRDRLAESIQQLETNLRPRAAEMAKSRAPVELDAALAEGRRISDELLAPLNDGAPASAAIVRERIAERLAREIGNPVAAAVANRSKAAAMVRDAGKALPADWVEAANAHGPMFVRSTTGRGWQYTVGEGLPPKIRLSGFGRVDAIRGHGYIIAGNPRTALHEFVHRVQHVMPEIDDYFQQLHVRRTAGKPQRLLSSVGRGYGKAERFRDGGYINAYMGKEYAQAPGLSYRGRAGALEMMPMSIEYVLARPDADFFLFKELDRELFDLTMWVLFRMGPGVPR